MRITLQAAKQRYGEIKDGAWPDEAMWCVFIPVPNSMRLINSATGLVISRIYCNRDMAAALERALDSIVSLGMECELDTFDGCFMVRDVRGKPGELSTHAYALAIDLNAKRNPLGGPVHFSPALVRCFTDAGFDWGGNFKRVDGMHFSFAWEGRDLEAHPQ